MNGDERLLEVALAEVASGRSAPDFAATDWAVISRRRAVATRWLQAALVLIALGVVAGVFALRAPAGAGTAQQPQGAATWPCRQVHCDAPGALDAVDAGTVDLLHTIGSFDDLRALSRLRALRRLTLNPRVAQGQVSLAENVPADALAPLAELPALESLTLPFVTRPTRALLAPLAKAPHFAHLGINGQTIDPELVAALASLPRLRSLQLLNCTFTADGAVGFGRLEQLEELELFYCRVLDAAAQEELARLPRLRRLRVIGAGAHALLPSGVRLDVLQPALLRSLARTPGAALELRSCTVDAELVAAIPSTLGELQFANCDGLTPPALRGLARCAQLRCLGLGAIPAAGAPPLDDAEVALVGALHLEVFACHGPLTAGLCAALRAQPDLREVELTSAKGDQGDLAFLTGLPRLQRVVLWNEWPVEQLRPLHACKALRRVELRNWRDEQPETAAVRELLPSRIEVLAW